MNRKIRYYESVLTKNPGLDYLGPARQTIDMFKEKFRENITLINVTALVTAPVLLSYTAWVLLDARERGVRRLYFLSRDAYVMYKMALLLCESWEIGIECRYFYCSRYALRAPLYISSREYALERLFDICADTTAMTVMKRAGINQDDAITILSSINWPGNLRLDTASTTELKTRLLRDVYFEKLAYEAAQKAEKQVRSYFLQELGDTASLPFALVDTGWLGSMQESICRNYNHIFGISIKPDGYYFGMYANGNPQFGRYHCWFFSPDVNYQRIKFFNNNLFECMCAADHGMTMGYEEKGGEWHPTFQLESDSKHVTAQLSICEAYVGSFLEKNPAPQSISLFSDSAFLLLKSLMAFPTHEEAEFYGSLKFSDEATGEGMTALAKPLRLREYWIHSLLGSVIRKFFGVSREYYVPSFWLDGSVALSKFNVLIKLDMCFLRLAKYLWVKIKTITRDDR